MGAVGKFLEYEGLEGFSSPMFYGKDKRDAAELATIISTRCHQQIILFFFSNGLETELFLGAVLRWSLVISISGY